MHKSKNPFKTIQKKKKLLKVPNLQYAEPYSSTPSLKILTQPSTGRSAAITRDTQSHTSSPNTAREDFRSIQPSPSLKDSLKIDNLLQYSLKRFKSEKLELAKIKEFAEIWKNKRKKKIQEYNLNTRIENKCKTSWKELRPKTAWESPTAKERSLQTPQVLTKHTATTSIERRANIGLEHYQLKSPRNTTPKNLQVAKKPRKEDKKEESKKKIAEFIKKKRKERQKKLKKTKEQEEENEIKRLAELMKLERITKQLMKPQKKGKKPKLIEKKVIKKCKSKKVVKKCEEVPEILNKRSICYSEDEEVLNIMQVRKLSSVDHEVNAGRQCMIFADSSEQISHDKSKDQISQLIEKRVKSEELSLVVSSSMPIIELKSISNDTSSELSEKKLIFQRAESARLRVNIQESKKKSQSSVKFLLILKKFVKNSVKVPFALLKYYKLSGLTFSELSHCLKNTIIKSELQSTKKFDLDQMLSEYIQPQEDSKDLESIWEKLENFNASEISKTIKANETAPNNKFTNESALDSENSINEHSMSLVFESSDEDPNIKFDISRPLHSVAQEEEPKKPLFIYNGEIFIQDEEGSLISEKVSGKESSFLVTPESEEIEEFSSISKQCISMKADIFINPFNTSESTLLFDEEEIVERTIYLLIKDLYLNAVHLAVAEFHSKNSLQLLGNIKIVVRNHDFFTCEEAVEEYIKKAWNRISLEQVKNLFSNKDLYLEQLGNCRMTPAEHFLKSISIPICKNTMEYAVIIHNKMLDDFIKFELFKTFEIFRPSPWRSGVLISNKINFPELIQFILNRADKLCKVTSGKIPTIEMVKNDGFVDEDLLQNAREQGLENILACDIELEESGWSDYSVEEQVSVFELADYIFYSLIEEIKIFD